MKINLDVSSSSNLTLVLSVGKIDGVQKLRRNLIRKVLEKDIIKMSFT